MIVPSHWQTQKFHTPAFISVFTVRGGYYTAKSYDVIRDVFVVFTSAKAEVISFDNIVSDHQSLALLDIVHINQASDQLLGLRQSSETVVLSER